jgi:hypothetical protein
MLRRLFTAICCCCALSWPQPATAQSATPAPAPMVFTSDMGFTYEYPSDWTLVDTNGLTAGLQPDAGGKDGDELGKKAFLCTQIGFAIHNDRGSSAILAMTVPFDCLGLKFDDHALRSFGRGVLAGMSGAANFSSRISAVYQLGTHNLWIGRERGTLKANPQIAVTLETSCTLLKKGAVCWTLLTTNSDIAAIFEGGRVSLEGEAPTALVPPTAFDHLEPDSAPMPIAAASLAAPFVF